MNETVKGYLGFGRIDRFVGSEESQDKFSMIILPDFSDPKAPMNFSPDVQECLMGVLKDGSRSGLTEIIFDTNRISFVRTYEGPEVLEGTMEEQSPEDYEKSLRREKYELERKGALWIGTFKSQSENSKDHGVVWFKLRPIHEDDQELDIIDLAASLNK